MSFSLEQTKELQVNSMTTNIISNTHIIKEIMLSQIIEVFIIVTSLLIIRFASGV